jgi:hypothetical protein
MPVARFSLRTWPSRNYRRGDAFTGRGSGFSFRAAGGEGAALAAHASHPVAVFLAEVGDAGCAGFEDPQAGQAQKRDQCEVVRVGRQPGGGDQGLELATSADPRESRHLPQDLNRDAATHVVAAKN